MAQDASEGRLGVITRRMFVGAIAGSCVAREHLVLEAVAAERMPHRMVVRGVKRAPFFELRVYERAEVGRIFRRHGLKAVVQEDGRFLFAFGSLAERERVWREVSADPEWIAMQSSVWLREIAIYASSENIASVRTLTHGGSAGR